MRNFKTLIATAAMALCGVNAMAQNTAADAEAQQLGYYPQPYGFVQLQGGMGTTLTNVNAFKLATPTFSVGVGGMFSHAFGARIHVNGYKSTGGFKMPNTTAPEKYKYNYINSNVDLMLNVLNLFRKTNKNVFDLYLIGGVGLNYAWDNKEFETLTSTKVPNADMSNAWGPSQTPRTSLLGHNLRVGILADFNLSKHFSLGIEVDANSLDDRFNSKYANSDDWMLTGQLSLTYKFGHKKAKKAEPAPEPVPVVPVPVPVEKKVEPAVVAPVPVTPAPAVVDEPLKETIFYTIRNTDPDPESVLKKVVAWCKKYPNKTISVDGYADKGTGSAAINVKYAKGRADKVAKRLQELGIPAKQMTVNSYGDKVQPFDENDRNRCVIIVGGK